MAGQLYKQVDGHAKEFGQFSGLRLADAALSVQDFRYTALGQHDAATSRIGQSASEAGQSLTLGAPPLIAANIIVQAIKEFRTHRPGLRIQLHDENVATILPLVQAGKLDIGLGPFESATGVRRTPLFRSPLVVVRPDNDPAFRRATTTWSALRNEKLITLRPTGQIQQLMSKHLSRAGIKSGANTSVNLLDTQIAMVEAGDGIAVIPSFFMSACRNRRVSTSRLVNPVVTIGLYLISNRAKKLPQGADEFTEFLKSFVGRWIDHVEGGLR